MCVWGVRSHGKGLAPLSAPWTLWSQARKRQGGSAEDGVSLTVFPDPSLPLPRAPPAQAPGLPVLSSPCASHGANLWAGSSCRPPSSSSIYS